jgi:hypothetical protein
MKTLSTSPRNLDLYNIFRSAIIADALEHPTMVSTVWNYIPDLRGSISRMQCASLIRNMMRDLSKDFPGGVRISKGVMGYHPDFVDFLRTHHAMGSSIEDMVAAWNAMRGIT